MMDNNGLGLPIIQQEKKGPIRKGRRKINIEYIPDKTRRHVTFSKRKAGIMKKAYELATLTGTQVLLLVASETGHVYTFATPKLQPLITGPEGKNLIQTCLNVPDDPTPDSQGKLLNSVNSNEGSNGNPDFKVHPYLHKKDASPEDDDEDSTDHLFKRHSKTEQKLTVTDDLAIPNYLPMGGHMGGGMTGGMGGGPMGGGMGGGPMGGGMCAPIMGGGGPMGGSMGGGPLGSTLPYPSLPHMFPHRQMPSVPYGSHMPHMASHFYQQESQPPRFPGMLSGMPGMIPPPMSSLGMSQGMYSDQPLDGQEQDDQDDDDQDDDDQDDDEY